EILEIPVEIAVSGEIRNLVQLLTQLEGARKLVVVQDVKVRVMNVTQPKDLLATVTLAGIQGGTLLPIRVAKVLATETSAGQIVGLV
ncbi:MAG: hypothetical protein HY371_03415, partial [Devosia nanyangense]|nr:hypothetical protein [Devosia nanyangense]